MWALGGGETGVEPGRFGTGGHFGRLRTWHGTVYNDHMELTSFDQLFGDRRLPVYSIKGAIGHTLGAAGGIEVVLGLKSLSEGLAPPTLGFSKGADNTVERVSSRPAVIPRNYLLSTNSGFGGINASLILAKGRGA